MKTKPIVIDARGHLLGRLAAIVAKTTLQGQRVVVVRCEGLVISGNFYRNKLKYLEYLRKRMNTNPKKGPLHFRSPGMMFFKAVRGMVPRKSPHGQAALARLKVFEGVPHPYDTKKKMVVPQALRVVKFNPQGKYTVLGELAASVGWRHKDIVKKLEDKRKEKAKVWYQNKANQNKAKEQAFNKVKATLGSELKTIEESGY